MLECPNCKHRWLPRIDKPQRCPFCKYILNKPPKKPKVLSPRAIIIPKPEKDKSFSLDEPQKPQEEIVKEPTEEEIKQSIKEIHEKGEEINFEL